MSDITQYYTYLAIVLTSMILSLVGARKSNREDKFLSMLLFLTFISEVIAIALVMKYKNNVIVFHFFNPIQLFLIALYYNEIIPSFKRKKTGIYIGILALVFSAINSLFIQTIDQLNSYTLLLEGLTIIAMTLQYFLEMIKTDKIGLFRSKYLWINVILLFFWSVTYTLWALSNVILLTIQQYGEGIRFLLWIVNIITYGGLAIIFILNKKKVLHNEY